MGRYNSGGGRGAMRQGQFWDLDIAVLKRLDMLRPGFQKSLVWSTNGEERARIQVEAYSDHLILDYRSRDRGGEWEPIRDRIPLSFTTPTMAVNARGSFAHHVTNGSECSGAGNIIGAPSVTA